MGASSRHAQATRGLARFLVVFSLVTVVSVAGVDAAQAAGSWVKTKPGYDRYYQGIDFVDNLNGWLVGEEQIILHTTDGGATWTQQHLAPGAYGLYAVQMWSPTRGWAVGNGGALFGTTNGSTWVRQSEPSGSYLGPMEDLCFVSANEGWAVGSSSHIIHTASAGATWTMRNGGVPEGVDDVWFNGVDFSDSTHGWAVGEDFHEGKFWASVYATANGGSSWAFEWPARTFTEGRLNDVEFFPPSGLWVCGEDATKPYGQRGMIWYTNTPGDPVWTRQALPEGVDELNAIHFVTASDGWAVGDDVILVTHNGGGLWTIESDTSRYNGILTDVDSVDGVTAWASGFGDLVMRRGNAPTTADALPLPPSPVSDVLEPPFFLDLWSLRLSARQQVIATVTSAADSLEACLWPPGTEGVGETSTAVARSQDSGTVKRFKYGVPAGAGGTYYIQVRSTDAGIANAAYRLSVDVQSPTTRVTVAPPAVAGTVRAWRDSIAYGTLKPLHFFGEKSVKVVWQKYSGGRWRTDAIMRPTNTDYGGYTRYQVSFRIAAYGRGAMRWRVQAVHLKDALHPQTASAWRYFSVVQ